MGGRRRRYAAPLVLGLLLLVAGCTRTTIPGLQVRSAPETDARSIATIPQADTSLLVRCWTRGERVYGDPVWYRISSPEDGYVTNYYVRTSGDFADAPPC